MKTEAWRSIKAQAYNRGEIILYYCGSIETAHGSSLCFFCFFIQKGQVLGTQLHG